MSGIILILRSAIQEWIDKLFLARGAGNGNILPPLCSLRSRRKLLYSSKLKEVSKTQIIDGGHLHGH
ncbi:hypothetical protein J6590_095328 [Homalodisca vitripennis]|nr:hypothetical protein J6590_095328 [Homalodisca vitripennis]